MVIQYGVSGAEKDLIDFTKQMGFSINDINEIDLILKDIERQYDEKTPIIYDQIKAEIDELHEKIEAAEKDIPLKKSWIVEDIKEESNDLTKEIEELDSIKFDIKHLFKYFSSKLKLRRSIKRLYYLELNTESEISKRLENSYSSLKSLKHKHEYLESNPDEEVESRLSYLTSQIHNLNEIKKSNTYKGALGELKVIQNLHELSDEYYLFNDLHLKLKDYIKFSGSPLKSAQIDHLVVGPTGVFVIETKNWSKQYVQSVFNDGSYTPYDQIQRSSYLVYRYLNNNKYRGTLRKIYYNLAEDEAKVKSIIAIAGSKVPFEKHRFVKVLPYYAVASHIEKSKQILTNTSVNEVVSKWC